MAKKNIGKTRTYAAKIMRSHGLTPFCKILTPELFQSLLPSNSGKEVLVQMTLNNVIRWIMAEAAGVEHRPVDLQFLAGKRLILAVIPTMTAAQTASLPIHLLGIVGIDSSITNPCTSRSKISPPF